MYVFNPYTRQVRGLTRPYAEEIALLRNQLQMADAVVLGAGSGLSTAAGYTYTGTRFTKYFADFAAKYHFRDMYSGGFYPYQTAEEFWGFWCRNIWLNRYAPIPSDLYDKLFSLLQDKEYFVLTTNVDHCFQRSGFDKKRLFYTQGDYGLFQSQKPAGKSAGKTYDNYEIIRRMILAEGYEIDEKGNLYLPQGRTAKMTVPSDLLPVCPDDGQPLTTNLRIDDTFVEDAGWQAAHQRYEAFLAKHEGKRVLYLELGVGMNTPVIIKFPFWSYTKKNRRAFYACVNLTDAGCSEAIVPRSICIEAEIEKVLADLIK